MNEKFVYAVYESIEEANQAVRRLTHAGVPFSAMTLYADDDVIEEIHKGELLVELKELDDDHDHRSMWNRITDFFSMSDNHEEGSSVDFSGYQDDIEDDKILVVLDKSYEAEALTADSSVEEMDAADPNQVETFVHENPLNHQEANSLDDEVELKEEKICQKDKVLEGKGIAGDSSRESDISEAYYTNIDAHKVAKKKHEPDTYVKDPESDDELRRNRAEKSVAGDMGSYSDYSEYHQKTTNKSDKESQHELGEFEEEMRRHEANPPADEFGVNTEQFDNHPE